MLSPFVDINSERFNQPLFGACNLCGRVRFESSWASNGEIKWKFHFVSGGTGTFLGAFLRLMKVMRSIPWFHELTMCLILTFFLVIIQFDFILLQDTRRQVSSMPVAEAEVASTFSLTFYLVSNAKISDKVASSVPLCRRFRAPFMQRPRWLRRSLAGPRSQTTRRLFGHLTRLS